MFAAIKTVVLISLASIALLGVVSGQRISIVSPKEGQVIRPGDTLQVELSQQSTTSSIQNIAFSFGLDGYSNAQQDSTSLGRPYLGSQFAASTSGSTSNPGNYSFQVTIPSADQFTDGFDKYYEFRVAHFYLLGTTLLKT